MDIASASTTLAEGRVPQRWSVVAAMLKADLSKDELQLLTKALDAFIARLLCQLEALSGRLINAGFQFTVHDHHLRATTQKDVAALDMFIEQHGPVPLSVEAWYRRIASFNFSQHGSQMFDRSLGFWFMHRFHEFTMPPIATACSSRWDEFLGWEGDDDEIVADNVWSARSGFILAPAIRRNSS